MEAQSATEGSWTGVVHVTVSGSSAGIGIAVTDGEYDTISGTVVSSCELSMVFEGGQHSSSTPLHGPPAQDRTVVLFLVANGGHFTDCGRGLSVR